MNLERSAEHPLGTTVDEQLAEQVLGAPNILEQKISSPSRRFVPQCPLL